MSKAKRVIEMQQRRIAALEAQVQALVLGKPASFRVPDEQFFAIYDLGQDALQNFYVEALFPLHESVKDVEIVVAGLRMLIFCHPDTPPDPSVLNAMGLRLGHVLSTADTANRRVFAEIGRGADLARVHTIRDTTLDVANGVAKYADLVQIANEPDGLTDISHMIREIHIATDFDPETLHLYHCVVETIKTETPPISISKAIKLVASREGYSPAGVKSAYYRVHRRRKTVRSGGVSRD